MTSRHARAPRGTRGTRARSSDGRRCRRAALPGSRVEAYRAGMMATMVSGGTESTVEPVDAGCTTNNNTTAKQRVLRSPERRMNLKRTTTIAVVGAVSIAWLAGAMTLESCDSVGRRRAAIADREARRGARDRNRAAARAARAWRHAAITRPQSVHVPRRRRPRASAAAAVAAPRPALTESAPAPIAQPSLKLVRHRRRCRRRRSGPHRVHLRRADSCSWSRKARR